MQDRRRGFREVGLDIVTDLRNPGFVQLILDLAAHRRAPVFTAPVDRPACARRSGVAFWYRIAKLTWPSILDFKMWIQIWRLRTWGCRFADASLPGPWRARGATTRGRAPFRRASTTTTRSSVQRREYDLGSVSNARYLKRSSDATSSRKQHSVDQRKQGG